jgi:hypothetical protein
MSWVGPKKNMVSLFLNATLEVNPKLKIPWLSWPIMKGFTWYWYWVTRVLLVGTAAGKICARIFLYRTRTSLRHSSPVYGRCIENYESATHTHILCEREATAYSRSRHVGTVQWKHMTVMAAPSTCSRALQVDWIWYFVVYTKHFQKNLILV